MVKTITTSSAKQGEQNVFQHRGKTSPVLRHTCNMDKQIAIGLTRNGLARTLRIAQNNTPLYQSKRVVGDYSYDNALCVVRVKINK
jgi:hypothetical protein